MKSLTTQNSLQPYLRPKSVNRVNNIQQKNGSIILFSEGVGINPSKGVPMRLAAYLLPVIKAVAAASENRFGQVYLADQAALRIGQNPGITENNARMMEEYIASFIERFFPDIQDRIVVSREKPPADQEISKIRSELVEEMVQALFDSRDQALITFAKNRLVNGSIMPAFRYMAEHSLFMRDEVTDDDSGAFLVDNPAGMNIGTLVMVGGPSEEIFYKARGVIVAAFKTRKKMRKTFDRVQTFTDIGARPTYYALDNEPMLSDDISGIDVKTFLSNLNPMALKDFIFLLCTLADEPDTSPLDRISNFSDKDYDLLGNGFRNLQIFLQELNP